MFQLRDGDFDQVQLASGYSYTDTPFGRAIKIENLVELMEEIRRAVLRKLARLDGSEVAWLRRQAMLTQADAARLLSRTEDLLSLIERGKRRIEALMDREFRRLVASRLQVSGLPELSDFSWMAAATRRTGSADYIAQYSAGRWSVAAVLSADQLTSVTSGFFGREAEMGIVLPDWSQTSFLGRQASMTKGRTSTPTTVHAESTFERLSRTGVDLKDLTGTLWPA